MPEEMFTALELKDKLKVSLPAIRKWTRNGMPCRRLGGRLVRFELASVVAWLEKKSVTAEVTGNDHANR